MNIRPAVPADAEALSALAERTFRDTFGPDNQAAHMDAYCATAYSPTIQGRELADANIRTLVAETDDGVLRGYAQLCRSEVPPSVTGPEPIELVRFYIDREFHGQGLATLLMARTVDVATSWGARTLWLGVWERNFRAQKFYRKCGFVDAGTHIFMLGDDPQTDLLMSRELGHTLR